jgi:pimeloyl-ACP methyl ester carboxylesterase
MSEFLNVHGQRIEHRFIGRPSGPTLVLLHEGLGSVSLWRDYPDALFQATGLPVFVYSRPGYGQSDPVPLPRPLTYKHDEARIGLPATLAAAGIDEPILFGHSDGASIALIAQAEGHVHARAMILEAPHVFVEDLSLDSIRKAKLAYETSDLRARLARHHAHVDVAFRGWNDSWLDAGFATWNLTALLPGISVPLLLLQGDADPYGTKAQLEAIAQGARGVTEIVLFPGCGHAPHRESSDTSLKAVSDFLSRHLS